MKEAIVLYAPGWHKGYRKFITNNGERMVDTIFLIPEDLARTFEPEITWLFEKDLRAETAMEMQKAITSFGISKKVKILNEKNLNCFDRVIIPDDDELVDHVMASLYPAISPQKEKWFIRWTKKTTTAKQVPVPDACISTETLDREIMADAFTVAEKTSDFWRQVGVVLLPIGSTRIIGYNHHLPHAQAPYINGDTRTNFKPGECIELSTAVHAEVSAIAFAAKKGISLDGASMYVTTFPCPNCARLIIESGIKKVYYSEGYSLLDAMEIFSAAKVVVTFVDVQK